MPCLVTAVPTNGAEGERAQGNPPFERWDVFDVGQCFVLRLRISRGMVVLHAVQRESADRTKLDCMGGSFLCCVVGYGSHRRPLGAVRQRTPAQDAYRRCDGPQRGWERTHALRSVASRRRRPSHGFIRKRVAVGVMGRRVLPSGHRNGRAFRHGVGVVPGGVHYRSHNAQRACGQRPGSVRCTAFMSVLLSGDRQGAFGSE